MILQKNIRSWCTLRTWDWFKLYGKVKPLLKAGKATEEMEKLEARCKVRAKFAYKLSTVVFLTHFQLQELEETLAKEEKAKKELEEKASKLLVEKNAIFAQLQSEKDTLSDSEDRIAKVTALKADLEKQSAVKYHTLIIRFKGYISRV